MALTNLPPSAAWRHLEARDGFESVFIRADGPGYRFEGCTAAVEEGAAWFVCYTIILDERWATRTATVWSRSEAGEREVRLEADGSGHWKVDGSPAPELFGCLDVDLASSACTNTFPVHRLQLAVDQAAQAPAAYVRIDLGVDRLDQEYRRLGDDDDREHYYYRAPSLGFECRQIYDASGLVLDYPEIATRVL